MLGVAGVLGQEILNPSVNWYTEAALPQNLPAPFTNINMGGLLAWEFLMMHFVEVRRWQDIRKHGSVNEVGLEGRVWWWGGLSGGGGPRRVVVDNRFAGLRRAGGPRDSIPRMPGLAQ
jgi:hypothetical protein